MENRILNLGIMAHVDAGKTTLTESLLYHGKVTAGMGNVDKGTTVTDSMALEKARGMTIRASTVSFFWEGVKVNLIDTPGHADFIGEVERSLRVLDGVVLVVSAVEGVQPQTRILFHHLERMKMPVLIFINKVDRIGADYERTCAQLCGQLSPRIVRMQAVEAEGGRDCRIRSYSLEEDELSQQIIGYSERLLEKYLEEKPISEEELGASLRFRTGKGRIYPVYAGAALRDVGVTALMRGIVSWLPVREPVCRKDHALSAYVYKIEFDEKGKKKAYLRVFAGKLSGKEKVTLADREETVVIHNLETVRNGRQIQTAEVAENDIGILTDVPQIRCGDFLGEKRKQKGLICWGEPMLQVEVHSAAWEDRFRLLQALRELECEDPLLHIHINPETQEIQVSLFGNLQIEILEALLRERFGIRAFFSGIRTIYKAKPIRAVSAQIRLNEPGNLHRAGIGFLVEPLPAGTGNRYETRVSFGFIQKPFQNAVRDGVRKALEDGLGDGMVDTKVTFAEADYDSVTSTPADFRRLAPKVFCRALRLAGVYRLEPVMTYRLISPTDFEKKVMGELGKMAATIEHVAFAGSEMTVQGQVAYDRAKEFSIALRTLTGGKGIWEMEFLEYRKLESLEADFQTAY